MSRFNKLNRRHAQKALDRSEGQTTARGGAGHARERHAAPTVDGGLSVDAFLIGRCAKAAAGARMSAFKNARDQDRAVSFALGDGEAVVVDSVDQKGRKIVRSKVKAPLTDISVRIAVANGKGGGECHDAKLREVMVIYDEGGPDRYVIVTAYPSGAHP